MRRVQDQEPGRPNCPRGARMSGEKAYCMVMCACPDSVLAEKLAGSLVANKFAACVQILPIRSFYQWKGAVCRDEEVLLLIKTRGSLYGEVEAFIARSHPYEVPEIVRCEITGGLQRYLAWIDDVTSQDLG